MGSAFDEVWLTAPDGQSLGALINGDHGWPMYPRFEGEAGFSSRNLSYDGDPETGIEYVLRSGQRDQYPASWALSVNEVRRAFDYFTKEHRRPPFVAWHED